jgi:hypothetical protein
LQPQKGLSPYLLDDFNAIKRNVSLRGYRFIVAALVVSATPGLAQAPWPGESWRSSVNLTSLASSDWETNLSGAFWNSERRQLWVVSNSGVFHRLMEGGNLGFKLDGRWACGGDAEGITQANLEDNSVLVMNEDGYIEEYSTAVNGKVEKLHSWDIRPVAEPVDGSGPEGIAFVPDAWLTSQGFTDKAGKAYASVNGMGGLIFVAHQDGGDIHVFDCKRQGNTWIHVGTYATGREESSDLAFDRSSGVLYIWHNIGSNSIEAVRLASQAASGGRAFTFIKEFAGPKAGNLEGMAITPAASGENWYFATDDDNQDGWALMWFREFKPGLFVTSLRPPSRAPARRSSAAYTLSGRKLKGASRQASFTLP